MSKPLNDGLLNEILETNFVRREEESLLQILNLLEILRQNKNEKMARISGELSEILDYEDNLAQLLKASNLEELCELLGHLRKDKMLKVYELSYLKERFPQLAKDNFLKIN